MIQLQIPKNKIRSWDELELWCKVGLFPLLVSNLLCMAGLQFPEGTIAMIRSYDLEEVDGKLSIRKKLFVPLASKR